MDSIIIRKATPQDAPGLARVHVVSWQESYKGIVPQSYLDALDIASRTTNWTNHLQRDDSFDVYLAILDNEVVGIAAGGTTRDPDLDFDASFHLIYVLEAVKGQGIGRRLMRTVTQSLLEKKFNSAMLWVLADNPSRYFYEHLGGNPVATKTISIGGVDLEEVAYGWDDLVKILL